jgi:multimeric flavodoxin WrbA
MKVIAVNGSPRKRWNTATLLGKALEGAASKGAETELIHLYDLDFKGCVSCFSCKIVGGESYGKCAVKDDLTAVLERLEDANAVILGSPIYFGALTGEMRSFMERWMFQYFVYTDPPQSLFTRPIGIGLIYTMNLNEEQAKQLPIYDLHFKLNEMYLKNLFGETETLLCHDTFQFQDYSKVIMERFDPAKKARRREEVFPEDCRKAFDLGARLAREE